MHLANVVMGGRLEEDDEGVDEEVKQNREERNDKSSVHLSKFK